VGRSTAGVTLGTGEGGNAFGDRFFMRGYDAVNLGDASWSAL
jgi:catecholate siderophore receptor